MTGRLFNVKKITILLYQPIKICFVVFFEGFLPDKNLFRGAGIGIGAILIYSITSETKKDKEDNKTSLSVANNRH